MAGAPPARCRRLFPVYTTRSAYPPPQKLKFKTEMALWPLRSVRERYSVWLSTSDSFELGRCVFIALACGGCV